MSSDAHSMIGVTNTTGRRQSADTLDVAALYERYGPVIYRRILSFYDPNEAEEVLHEVFMKVIEKLGTFREESSPVTWLYQITTNHCLNRQRNQRNRRDLLRKNASMFTERPDGRARQIDQIFLNQLWQEVPDRLLQIATYYYVDGLTHAEIARIEGVSRRTIGNRIQEFDDLARNLASHREEEGRS